MTQVPDETIAGRFVVVDDEDRVRARFGMVEGTSDVELALLDINGKPLLRLCVLSQDLARPSESQPNAEAPLPQVALYDDDGRLVVQIGMVDAAAPHPAIRLFDWRGIARAAASLTSDGEPEVRIRDSKGETLFVYPQPGAAEHL